MAYPGYNDDGTPRAPAAPPQYRAPAPPAQTGDYATDSKAYQGWMDSYGRFDPSVVSGHAGYRPPKAPAANAAPAYSLTAGQDQPQTTPAASTAAPTAPQASPPPLPPQASPTAQASRFQGALSSYTDEMANSGGTVDTSAWTPDDFAEAAKATGSYYNPLTVGPPGSAQANAWAATQVYQARNPVDPNVRAQQVAESNALRSAFTASMGQLVSGPMSTPVSNPAEVAQRFWQSGYTGQQALADGWGTGTGLPAWMGQAGYWNNLDAQGRVGAPYVNQAPLVPPPPNSQPAATAVISTAPAGGDPYHPPGYTPGVAAQAPPPPAATPVSIPPPIARPMTAPTAPAMPRLTAQPTRVAYNPTATPNIPGQPVTDFTYPVGGQQPGGMRVGQPPTPPPPLKTVSRSTARNLGGL